MHLEKKSTISFLTRREYIFHCREGASREIKTEDDVGSEEAAKARVEIRLM